MCGETATTEGCNLIPANDTNDSGCLSVFADLPGFTVIVKWDMLIHRGEKGQHDGK